MFYFFVRSRYQLVMATWQHIRSHHMACMNICNLEITYRYRSVYKTAVLYNLFTIHDVCMSDWKYASSSSISAWAILCRNHESALWTFLFESLGDWTRACQGIVMPSTRGRLGQAWPGCWSNEDPGVLRRGIPRAVDRFRLGLRRHPRNAVSLLAQTITNR